MGFQSLRIIDHRKPEGRTKPVGHDRGALAAIHGTPLAGDNVFPRTPPGDRPGFVFQEIRCPRRDFYERPQQQRGKKRCRHPGHRKSRSGRTAVSRTWGFSFVREEMDRAARYRTRPESHVTDIRLVDTGLYDDIEYQNILGVEVAAPGVLFQAVSKRSLRGGNAKARWKMIFTALISRLDIS